ncbi:MAG: T9SS type A sorting domain-containing protein [Saprospiraceae bacterium]|nr:T9SS type A sorting domain-containing protein [Saprospiraceae bacterium]
MTQSPAIGATVSGAGSMTVTLTVTDINGLTNSCDFTVNKVDQTPPSITCPDAQILVLDVNDMATLPDYTGLAVAADNCGIQSVTQSPTSGTVVSDQGNLTVTLTVTDVNGLTNTCQFMVQKTQETALSITCPSMQTLVLGTNCSAALPDYTSLATVVSSVGIQSLNQSPAVGTIVSGTGLIEVMLTATNLNGQSAQCTFTVTKTDVTPPTVQCLQPAVTFNGEASIALSTAQLALISDNCGVQSVQFSPTHIEVIQLGQTVPVTVTATDINGNPATCTAQVSVGGLPAGWRENPTGIGCAAPCNNFEYNSTTGVWTGTSTGAFYGPPYTSDATSFAQRTLCGNGSITAQVTGISSTALGWAGVVMRESNAPGAKKAHLMTNLSNLSRREFRTATNDQSIQQQFPSQNRYWLRITRTGNQFNMFVSSNGISWFSAGTQNIVMDNCIQMGLVATNYTANSTVTATFAGVSYSGSNGVLALPDGGVQPLAPHFSSLSPDFEVYPNPTGGDLNIDLTQYIGRNVRIELYSIEGKLLQIKEMEDVRAPIEIWNLSEYAAGMYFLKVKSGRLPDVTKRVVLQR